MENDLNLAFPVAYSSGFSKVTHLGFSKLEYISAMCLQGLLNRGDECVFDMDKYTLELYAEKSVLLAKALIAELEKENK